MILLLLACMATDGSRRKTDTSTADTAAVPDDLTLWIAPTLSEHCTACHSGEAPASQLDLSGDLRAALVDARSVQVDGVLVTPGDRFASYLWLKLEGQQALVDGYGTVMPPGGQLDTELRDRIGGWIDAGAQ
ncbi:MAG: hypothetical protein ACI9K2_004525 [Myxococcota bacterium]